MKASLKSPPASEQGRGDRRNGLPRIVRAGPVSGRKPQKDPGARDTERRRRRRKKRKDLTTAAALNGDKPAIDKAAAIWVKVKFVLTGTNSCSLQCGLDPSDNNNGLAITVKADRHNQFTSINIPGLIYRISILRSDKVLRQCQWPCFDLRIDLLKADSPVNSTWSPQGFSN